MNKINIDSNFARQPFVFLQAYGKYGHLVRDLTLYFCQCNFSANLLHRKLELPVFYKLFGYNRQILLRKAGPEEVKQMQKVKGCEEFETVIEYALFLMMQRNVIFEKYHFYDHKTDSRKSTLKPITLIQELTVERKKTGTEFSLVMNRAVLYNSQKKFFTRFDLDEYLSLRHSSGRPDHNLRSLYLRLSWKLGIWDFGSGKFTPSTDDFQELVLAANLNFNSPPKIASRLRSMIDFLGRTTSLSLNCKIELEPGIGYKVNFRRSREKAAA